jgi:hypothetical protein
MGTKNNPGKFDCYSRAEPDEPVFVLLGRDPVASLVIEYWAELRAVLSTSDEPEKLNEAMDCARAMRAWAEAHGKEALVRKIHETERRHTGRMANYFQRVLKLEALCGRAADVIAEQVSINVADGGLRGRQELDDIVRELRGA